MERQDDNILVQRIIKGETDTYRTIVEKYQKTIFYLGLKFFHNHADAEDFAQEVFLKAFENLKSFGGKVPFKGWLYKLAFNLAVNQYHLDKKRFLLSGELKGPGTEENLLIDQSESIENRIIRNETRDEINKICKELPGVYNVVVKMHFFDGFKLKEIKEILDVPLNTVKSYISRAKNLIKKKLLALK
ncbi:MAG: sigma-70 family RNA polymerase sigma factor [Spirochaetales bacterium]|nr:sigma-70 family RNA polymerase sigma factor [Spirochaetales bacterium]